MSKQIAFRNVADNLTSILQNNATVSRTWTMQNADGTVAHLGDLNFYNVLNYGLIADAGVTDNSTALQALVDLAPAGSTIYFPIGFYKVNTGITYNKALNIVGSGGMSIVYTLNNITVFSCNPAGASYIFYPTWQDIRIERSGTATSGCAIRVNKCIAMRFINVHVNETFNVIELYNCLEWVMDSCRFAGWYNAGVIIANDGSDTDRNDSSMVSCQFSPFARNCLYSIYQQNGGGLKITNTKFNYGAGGKANYHYYYTGTASTSDLMISNCSFENFTLAAIRIHSPTTSFFRKICIVGNQLALGDDNSKFIIISNIDCGTIVGNQFHTVESGVTAIEIINSDDWLINNNYVGFSTNLLLTGTCLRINSDSDTDVTAALALKANIASPTFTGTVGGITKSMVGLNLVDNTADTSKPVSTAQAAAIALKVSLTAFVDGEVPSGTMNSTNVTFIIANTPIAGSVQVYWNGIKQRAGIGYTISGVTITMINPPDSGDTLEVYYRK